MAVVVVLDEEEVSAGNRGGSVGLTVIPKNTGTKYYLIITVRDTVTNFVTCDSQAPWEDIDRLC